MSVKEYYLDLYQALLDRDILKFTKLRIFNVREQIAYTSKSNNLIYEEIFGDKDADDFIDDLLDDEEATQFKYEYLKLNKELYGNYHVANYKAIIDGNYIKFLELEKLENSEKVNYPNEYPQLDYDFIFPDSDTDEVMDTLIDSNFIMKLIYYDYYWYQELIASDNLNITLSDITTRDNNYQQLMTNPAISQCPNHVIGLDIISTLKSVSYMQDFSPQTVESKYIRLFNSSKVIEELFSFHATSISREFSAKGDQFAIQLISIPLYEFNPLYDTKSTAGESNAALYNIILENPYGEINSGFLVHELYHSLMRKIFNNDSNPYFDEDTIAQDKYHQSIRAVLFNIAKFIKTNFNFEINIDENESTWDIGQELAVLLYPENIIDVSLFDEVIKIYKKNNLTLSEHIPWFGGLSLLSRILEYYNLELVDAYLKTVSDISIVDLLHAIFNHPSTVFRKIVSSYDNDINLIFANGKTLLDYANDEETYKVLFDHGFRAYENTYNVDICGTVYVKEANHNDSANTLNAIKHFLVTYIQNYDKSDEDCEQIVRIPQIIAQGEYNSEVAEIFRPILDYINEEISPRIFEYIKENNPSGICLPIYSYSEDYY